MNKNSTLGEKWGWCDADDEFLSYTMFFMQWNSSTKLTFFRIMWPLYITSLKFETSSFAHSYSISPLFINSPHTHKQGVSIGYSARGDSFKVLPWWYVGVGNAVRRRREISSCWRVNRDLSQICSTSPERGGKRKM